MSRLQEITFILGLIMTCEKVAINGPNLKETGTQKIKLAKEVAKEKKNPSTNPESV